MSKIKFELRISSADYEILMRHLFPPNNGVEQGAYLLTGRIDLGDRIVFPVREVIVATPDCLTTQSPVLIEFAPHFLSRVLKQARDGRWCTFDVHTHPFSRGTVRFSGIDDAKIPASLQTAAARVPGLPHGAIVFGHDCFDSVVEMPDGTRGNLKGIGIAGPNLRTMKPIADKGKNGGHLAGKEHHRQVLALGERGQQQLQGTRIGIVGLGGIGSHVFQQLAHLGVRNFVLVDPDNLEETNLSRVVGTSAKDVGKPKVELMHRFGEQISGEANIVTLPLAVEADDALEALKETDVLICCCDNFTSRGVLSAFASQHFLPLIDTATEVEAPDGDSIRSVSGRVNVILPDGPCLFCMNQVTAGDIARERRKEEARNYVTGASIPAPAVISFNGVVANLAVNEFLHLVTGFAKDRRPHVWLSYDAVRGTVRPIQPSPSETCPVCQRFRARGDSANPLDLIDDFTAQGGNAASREIIETKVVS